jgi:arylformamidase
MYHLILDRLLKTWGDLMDFIDLTHTTQGKNAQSNYPDMGPTVSTLSNDAKVGALGGLDQVSIEIQPREGTHIETPWSYGENEIVQQELNVKHLIGEAICLDLSFCDFENTLITSQLLEEAEERQGLYVEKDDILILNVGRSIHFKGFDISAIHWLIKKKINVLGIDSPIIETGDNNNFPIHYQLSEYSIYIIKNLDNADLIPKLSRFVFVGLPLKYSGINAVPIRALALLDVDFID